MGEGVILLNPKDKEALHKYLSDMNVAVSSYLLKYKNVESKELMNMMNKTSRSLPSNIFPFKIDYVFSARNQRGAYHKESNSIIIAVSYFCEWRPSSTDLKNSVFYVSYVDFNAMMSTLTHEFVHYIQVQNRLAKSGDFNISQKWDGKNYYKRGWERQAQALGYLEKLKNDLQIRRPETILNQLRKMGVLHSADLNKLKHTDIRSWKAIMKQAIMATMADIEDRKVAA